MNRFCPIKEKRRNRDMMQHKMTQGKGHEALSLLWLVLLLLGPLGSLSLHVAEGCYHPISTLLKHFSHGQFIQNTNNNQPYQPRPHSHSCPATHPEPAKEGMNGRCMMKSLQLAYSNFIGKSALKRQHHTTPQEHNGYKTPLFGVVKINKKD